MSETPSVKRTAIVQTWTYKRQPLHQCWDPPLGPQESSSWLICNVKFGAWAERLIIPASVLYHRRPMPGPLPDPRATPGTKESGFLEVPLPRQPSPSLPSGRHLHQDICVIYFCWKNYSECSQPRVTGTEIFNLQDLEPRSAAFWGQNFTALSTSLPSPCLYLQARES